jgi:hypothetical protein
MNGSLFALNHNYVITEFGLNRRISDDRLITSANRQLKGCVLKGTDLWLEYKIKFNFKKLNIKLKNNYYIEYNQR